MHGGVFGGNIIFAYIHGMEVEAERQSALPVRNERAQARARPILRKVQKTILVVGLLRGRLVLIRIAVGCILTGGTPNYFL